MSENEKRRETILRAYDELCDVTPARYDCGMLCGAICCKENESHGGDADCGMLLLPGEKELLSDENYEMKETAQGTLLICGGRCDRDFRPFACRIFPFYPQITRVKCGKRRYSIRLLPDPRAFGICPLLWERRRRKTTVRFLRSAKRAVRILMSDEKIRKFLCEQSELVDDISLLTKRLGK